MTDHIDLDARHKRLAVLLAAAAACEIDVTLDDCDFVDKLVAVVRTQLAMEKADIAASAPLSSKQSLEDYMAAIVAQTEAEKAADAAMQPFRPVAPSATDAAATGEQQ